MLYAFLLVLFYSFHTSKILSQPNLLKEQNKNQNRNHDVKKNFNCFSLVHQPIYLFSSYKLVSQLLFILYAQYFLGETHRV